MNSTTESDGYVCAACSTSFGSEAALERHVLDVGIVD